MEKVCKEPAVKTKSLTIFFNLRTCLGKFIFWSGPSFIFLIWKRDRKEEKQQNIKYLKNKNSFLEEIKNIFHKFWNTFFW